jgi:hypothetical protein
MEAEGNFEVITDKFNIEYVYNKFLQKYYNNEQ